MAVLDQAVRIGIEAPPEVAIHREEVYLEIEQANVEAAASMTETENPDSDKSTRPMMRRGQSRRHAEI